MRGIPFSAGIVNTNEYWKERNFESIHSPTMYLKEDGSTFQVLDSIINVLDESNSFLEIGCNAGRNLNFLYKLGFRELGGIEINSLSVHHQLKDSFSDLYDIGRFYIGNASEEIKNITNECYDVVFSISTLIHINPAEISLFQDMVRVSKKYIAISTSENAIKAYPYDFKNVFETLGCKLIEYKSFYGSSSWTLPKDLYNEINHYFNTRMVMVFIKNS